MKKNSVTGALITPAAEGWSVRFGGGGAGEVCHAKATLEEALGVVPSGARWILALPERVTVTERLALPSRDAEELTGMVQLQLEKALPYPLEEASFCYSVIKEYEDRSAVFSVAAGCEQLDQLCAPIRAGGRLPDRMILFAELVAAGCGKGEQTLCVWREQEALCLAVAESGRLGFVQGLQVEMESWEEVVREELPRFLLAVEMAGVEGGIQRVRVDRSAQDLAVVFKEGLGVEVDVTSFNEGTLPLDAGFGDLLPRKWRSEEEQSQKSGDLKARVQWMLAVYLLLIAGAFLWLAWLKRGVREIDARLIQVQPLVEQVNARRAQWNGLAPAVDPATYTVEILYQVSRSLPSPEVKITVFEQKAGGFKVEGEAPSPIQATEFLEKLRAESGLGAYRIDGPPPGPLPNGGARFTIFGKL
jgi:hypothetical protein